MNKMGLLVFLHGLGCLKTKLPVPGVISNTAPSYALGCNTTSPFIFIGSFNDTWLSVMPIFSEPIPVLYIAKNTCCNSVIIPISPLAL